MAQDFIVDRADLAQGELADAPAKSADPGTAVLRVERFALTANNITYGVAGDLIGYWQFFPALEGKDRIPVWGIGEVAESECDNVEVGQRYYGYFPMSHELQVTPDRVSPRGFVDSAPHRASLPPVYNQYSRMTEEGGFDPRFDNHQIIYRPLFTTSFVLDDYLADNGDFGADTVIVGSASSKTGFGLAFLLSEAGRTRVIGLTSSGNRAFVEGLGIYDEVVTYDDVSAMDAGQKAAYVDMAGNREVLSQVHRHFGDNLALSCGVGITHHDARGGEAPGDLPGAKPTMFFAPDQITKRNEEWGPGSFQEKLAAATKRFFERVDDWVTIEEHPFERVGEVYDTVYRGAPPDRAYVVTL